MVCDPCTCQLLAWESFIHLNTAWWMKKTSSALRINSELRMGVGKIAASTNSTGKGLKVDQVTGKLKLL